MERVPSTLTAAFSICIVSPLVLNTQWNLRPELGLLTTLYQLIMFKLEVIRVILFIIYLAADPNCLITRHTIHQHLVRPAVGHV